MSPQKEVVRVSQRDAVAKEEEEGVGSVRRLCLTVAGSDIRGSCATPGEGLWQFRVAPS